MKEHFEHLAALASAGVAQAETVKAIDTRTKHIANICEGPFNATAGAADNTAGIAAAINAVADAGGGQVLVPPGEFKAGALPQRSGVTIKGLGWSSCIRAIDGLNADQFKTANFDALKLAGNKWLVADGVQHGLGFEDIRLDGNRANNATGAAVRAYAKRIKTKNFLIHDSPEGWYSEAGDIPGQQSWRDLPESHIESTRVRDSGGFMWRGPHDARISGLYVNACDFGTRFETLSGVYNGSAEIEHVHSYANYAVNFYANADIRGHGSIIAESGFDEGAIIDSWFYDIRLLQVFDNCRTSGEFNARLNGKYGTARVRHRNPTYKKSGVRVTVQGGDIVVMSDGEGSGGVGCEVASSAMESKISGIIRGFTGVGGVALVTNKGGAAPYTDYKFILANSSTLWHNDAQGYMSEYHITPHALAGQTPFTGAGPHPTDGVESWNVKGQQDPSTLVMSQIRKTSGADVDLNSTAEQTLTIGCAELMGFAPEPEDVTFGLYYIGSNTTWELAYLRLAAVSNSVLTFKVKMRVAAGVAAMAKIVMQARIG